MGEEHICENCAIQQMIDKGPNHEGDKLHQCAQFLEYFLDIAVICANCADNSAPKEHNWKPRPEEAH